MEKKSKKIFLVMVEKAPKDHPYWAAGSWVGERTHPMSISALTFKQVTLSLATIYENRAEALQAICQYGDSYRGVQFTVRTFKEVE